jgi:hypothetical protein
MASGAVSDVVSLCWCDALTRLCFVLIEVLQNSVARHDSRTAEVRMCFRGGCCYAVAVRNRRSRRLFMTTLTLLNAIAALARMGLRSNPKIGNSTPAATGIPITL